MKRRVSGINEGEYLMV